MPTYSYRCTQCNHAFDIHQTFTDDTLTVCPNCAGTLRKVFSPVGVTFSGSGFYRTDSRAAAMPESSGSSESKKTDAAPAASSSSSSSSGGTSS